VALVESALLKNVFYLLVIQTIHFFSAPPRKVLNHSTTMKYAVLSALVILSILSIASAQRLTHAEALARIRGAGMY
jgi:hypothetical protein